MVHKFLQLLVPIFYSIEVDKRLETGGGVADASELCLVCTCSASQKCEDRPKTP